MAAAEDMRSNGRAGFTLIELMVVVALTITIMSILFLTISSSQMIIKDTTVKYDTMDAGMTIMETIGKDIGASRPPITNVFLDNDLEAGYIFIIRNHSETDRFDELWLTTTAKRGGASKGTLRNVRYFVYFDKNIRKRVLVRQEFGDMFADTDLDNLPWTVEDEEDARYDDEDDDGEEFQEGRVYEMFDGVVDRFEIQYLDMRFDSDRYACIPRQFVPSLTNHPTSTQIFDFRDPDVWGDSRYDQLDCSSPMAIRVVLYLKDYNGYKSVCFDRVFWIAHTKMPSDKWKPEKSD